MRRSPARLIYRTLTHDAGARSVTNGGANTSLIFGKVGLSQFDSCPNERKKESADSRQDRNRGRGNRSNESANNCP